VFETYDAIVDACCDAWNKLIAEPERITSIATREWALYQVPESMTRGFPDAVRF